MIDTSPNLIPAALHIEARIPLEVAADPGPETQEAFERYIEAHKALNNTIRQLAPFPAAVDMQRVAGDLANHITSVPKKVIEAARLRVAVISGCEYCVGWHTRFAERGGFTDEEVALICLADDAAPAGLDDEVRLGVRVSHEMSTGLLSDWTFNAALERWGQTGVVELIAVIGMQNATSRIASALKTPFEPAYARMWERKQNASK